MIQGFHAADAALFVMSFHDSYWRPADGTWNRTDTAEMLKRLYAGLKPGGVVVVQQPGGDDEGPRQRVGQLVGRIDRVDDAASIGGELAGRWEIDAGGMLLLPGGVDAHVHLSMSPDDAFPSTFCFFR